jgi:putative SOS response-associated peptidase YedK
MCTNYTPPTPQHLLAMPELGAALGGDLDWPAETFPGYGAPIVVANANGGRSVCVARYGLVPRWCKDSTQATALSRRTYNARSETVAEKPSYRAPWRESRFALAPMLNYFEPCWETGKAVRWRIHMADGAPFAVAGLHETWTDRDSGEMVRSFSLLTVNADGHPLLGRMHRPLDEKRMLVVVPRGAYGEWLHATPAQAALMMQATPAEWLAGEAAPRGAASPQLGLGF